MSPVPEFARDQFWKQSQHKKREYMILFDLNSQKDFIIRELNKGFVSALHEQIKAHEDAHEPNR